MPLEPMRKFRNGFKDGVKKAVKPVRNGMRRVRILRVPPSEVTGPRRYELALLNILRDMKVNEAELEESRRATLNILGDVRTAKGDLEIKSKELERRVFELKILREMGERIGYTLDFKRVLDIISTSLAKILDYSTVSYMLLELERATFNVYLNERVSSNFIKDIKKKTVEALRGLGAEKKITAITGTQLETKLSGETIDEKNKAGAASFFNVPLIVGEEVIGMLNISSTKPSIYKEEEMRVLYTIASQASIAISRLQALIRSETERTSALVESLSNGLVMFNLEHKVLIINPAAKKILALPEEKLNLFEIARIFEKVGLYEKIEKCLKTGETNAIEEAEAKDRIYEIFVSSVKDYEGKIIGGSLILHDVTHRREIERAKTEFVSVASHQLRTPLSSIGWFAEMLLDEEVGKINEGQKDYLQQIYDSNRRMTALINDLLNISRIEAGKIKIEPRPTQLHDLVKSLVRETEAICQSKRIKVIFTESKEKIEFPKVNIDPDRIRQALQNLISNAINYNKKNGTVGIGLSIIKKEALLQRVKKQAPELVEFFSASDVNQWILIVVLDTGIGIPKAQQAKLFSKFFRADNAVKAQPEGTGLGIFICKSIIDSSGGKIWFESKENGGTKFWFVLPVKTSKNEK